MTQPDTGSELLPPPTRPAPPALRERIRTLTDTDPQAAGGHRTLRTAIAVGVAAASVAAAVWVVPSLTSLTTTPPVIAPAATATPTPTTTRTADSSTPRPSSSQSAGLSAEEIAAQTASCLDDPTALTSEGTVI